MHTEILKGMFPLCSVTNSRFLGWRLPKLSEVVGTIRVPEDPLGSMRAL
jgi:hypothetical protein